ncbi:hypothetical protein X975_00974, partial [Stegodyphus mimosarum]
MSVGLIADKYECPTSGNEMRLCERKDITDKFELRCKKSGENGHFVKRSGRKGIWFAESRLSMGEILLISYYWVNRLPVDYWISDQELTVVLQLIGTVSVEKCAWNFTRMIWVCLVVWMSLLKLTKVSLANVSREVGEWWKSYACLGNEGFQHLALNHKYHFKDPQRGGHTNTTEGTWGAIKSAIPKHYDKQNFAFYLAEHV